MVSDFLFVLGVALLFTLLYVLGTRRWRDKNFLLVFFLVLFFATWAGSAWINPSVVPSWGRNWLPFVVVGFIFTILLTALAPPAKPPLTDDETVETPRMAGARFNPFLLVLLILLGIAIIAAYL